jgi:hypothetical protein
MEMIMYIYTKTGREAELPIPELSNSQLTSWICDVLHGAAATDPDLREEIEASRIAALDCLTSLLINAQVVQLSCSFTPRKCNSAAHSCPGGAIKLLIHAHQLQFSCSFTPRWCN